MLEKPSIVTIQMLHLMSLFNAMSGGRPPEEGEEQLRGLQKAGEGEYGNDVEFDYACGAFKSDGGVLTLTCQSFKFPFNKRHRAPLP